MPPAKTDAENIATAKKAFIALMLEAGYAITVRLYRAGGE